jgi:hypothetical protein
VLTLAEHARLTEAILIVLAARAIWLLPDWLGKWQTLLTRRREARTQT